MRQPLIIGNWKMNGSMRQVTDLIRQINGGLPSDCSSLVAVMPPLVYIPLAKELLQGSHMLLGAQNVSSQEAGAYTGEVSASMLQEFDCRYVLVGHSERRNYVHEDDDLIAQKFHRVKEHDMIPVLCVGETWDAREQGQTQHVIARQLDALSRFGSSVFSHCVIAYEPVWAIGTGKTASPEQVQEVHQFIRDMVASVNRSDARNVQLLYGGSVNEQNARTLFALPDVDGGLIGGASLKAQQFLDIIACIN
jgi:triosephosphate isomerase (TIM)